MNRLIISAPFGNYINVKGATSTIGTFTAQERKGRWLQVARTVRYYPHIGAWVNKIGLRNPGIDSVTPEKAKGKIVSIHGFNEDEWITLISKVSILPFEAVELNLSCPNVPGGDDYPLGLFRWASETLGGVIVKIPPINYDDMVSRALDAGLTSFHCCNTIPIPSGGISGKPLKPVSIAVIRRLRTELQNDARKVTIIGGGGITNEQDIIDYSKAGADYFAIGSGSVWFWNLPRLADVAQLTNIWQSGYRTIADIRAMEDLYPKSVVTLTLANKGPFPIVGPNYIDGFFDDNGDKVSVAPVFVPADSTVWIEYENFEPKVKFQKLDARDRIISSEYYYK